MSQYKYAEIADTVYFWFAANTTAGAAGDGATPLYDVRLAGAISTAAPTASGTPTLLTHVDYTDGLHEIAIDTTGYAAGEYAVFCTLTISTVNPAGFCGSFKLRTAGTKALDVKVVEQANIDFGALQKASITAAVPAASSVASAVWDETLADHLGAGSTGNALNAAGAAGDPWSTAIPGAYGAGTAGKIVGDNLNTTVSSRSNHTAASVLAQVVEGTTTFNRVLQAVLAFVAGKAAGGGTATLTFRDQADSKDRITMTVDADGNRTNVTPSYD